MIIPISLGFEVDIDEAGKFELPNRTYSASDLNKIAREINRFIRKSNMEQLLEGNDDV